MSKAAARLTELVTEAPEARPGWAGGGLLRVLRRASGGDGWTSRFLRGLMWRYRRLVGLVLALNVTSAAFEGTTMAVFTVLLETLTKEQGAVSLRRLGWLGRPIEYVRTEYEPRTAFLLLVAVAVGSQIVKSLTEFAGKCAAAQLSTSIESDLRNRIFRQLVRMRYRQIARYRVGDLAAYVEQVTPAAGLIPNVNEIVYQNMTLAVYAAVLFWISWKMTLVAAVVLGVLVFSTRGLMARIRVTSKQFVKASTSMNEGAIELLSGIRHVHTYGREEFAVERVARDIEAGRRSRRRGLVLSAVIPGAMQIVAAIGIGILLGIAGTALDTNGITIAALLAFVLVLYRLLPRVTTANNKAAMLHAKWAYVERVAEILRRDDKEYLQSGKTAFPALREGIEFRDVSLRYDDRDEHAVRDLSFRIPKGTFTALVGPSGAGKSTVVNLLLRLYEPDGGTIVVDGTPLPELRVGDWRRQIGLVDQDGFVFHATVRENIRFGKLDATQEEIERAARIAAAHEFVAELPQGYDTVVGERGQRLSGGQRQRLAIARALVREPSILVLDEATSALDTTSERAIQAALDRIRRDFTVVAIAHRLSTIRDADQILVLDRGGVVERGTHDELVARGGLYARLWTAQAGERDGG